MSQGDLFQRVLLLTVLVIGLSRVLGMAGRRIRQPLVIAEILAGVLLGPSVLGLLAPAAEAWLVPRQVTPMLYGISQLGLLLYLFVLGIEFRLPSRARALPQSVLVAVSGGVVPCLAGMGLVMLTRGTIIPFEAPGAQFRNALFVGAALSVTALPVLARIIDDLGIAGTPIAASALLAGSSADVLAWVLLAGALALMQGSATALVLAVLGAVLAATFSLAVARPLMSRLDRDQGPIRSGSWALRFCLLGFLAWTTDAAGISPVFGAFLAGLSMPRDRVSQSIADSLGGPSRVLLLPVFFAYSGLQTRLDMLNSMSILTATAVLVLVASVAKGVACTVAARLVGWTDREAVALGALLNARGLVELVLINIALQRGIIGHTAFSMLVVVAVVTTVSAGPVAALALDLRRPARALAPAPAAQALVTSGEAG